MRWRIEKWLEKIHWGKAIAFAGLNVASAAFLCGALDNPWSIAIIAFFWGSIVGDLLR